MIVLENRDDDGAAACLDGKREAAPALAWLAVRLISAGSFDHHQSEPGQTPTIQLTYPRRIDIAADLMFIVREPLAFLADRMLVYDQIIIPADFNAIQRLEADVASRYFAGNLRLA